jgi:hypothetical protein
MKQKFTKVKSQSILKSENKINLNETTLDSAKQQGPRKRIDSSKKLTTCHHNVTETNLLLPLSKDILTSGIITIVNLLCFKKPER